MTVTNDGRPVDIRATGASSTTTGFTTCLMQLKPKSWTVDVEALFSSNGRPSFIQRKGIAEKLGDSKSHDGEGIRDRSLVRDL